MMGYRDEGKKKRGGGFERPSLEQKAVIGCRHTVLVGNGATCTASTASTASAPEGTRGQNIVSSTVRRAKREYVPGTGVRPGASNELSSELRCLDCTG